MKVFLEVEVESGPRERFEVGTFACRAIGRRGAPPNGETQTIGFESGPDPVVERLESASAARPRRPRTPPTGPRRGAFQRGADILLDDALASRTHALVFLDEEGPSLVDLGSTNGTFVNARSVSDADLADGDVIRIGNARLVVHVEAESD